MAVKAAGAKAALILPGKKSSAPKANRTTNTQDESLFFVSGISKAIRKKGIQREAIFVGRASSPKKVYAYSVLPSDTSKIVREAADGSIRVGHLRNGQFRALKSPKVAHAANG